MNAKVVLWSFSTAAALFSGMAISAETAPPAKAFEYDATVADPEHHKVLYEDDHVRIFELITMPGDTESRHTHPYPAIAVYDTTQAAFETVDDSGERLKFGRNFELLETSPAWPAEVVKTVNDGHKKFEAALQNGKLYSQFIDPRYVPTKLTNTDTIPMHSYRIEFKRVVGPTAPDKK
ncbi:MAG: hypothetical protein AB7T07_00030 [Steroidobacteraceae bacterium]